jgi:hypothetical protein
MIVGGPASVAFAQTTEMLAELLSEIPALQSVDTRQIVIEMLVRRGYALPELASTITGFAYSYQLIQAMANQTGALRQLASSLLKVDRTPPTQRFLDKINALLPSEIFTLQERIEFISFIEDSLPATQYNSYYWLAAKALPSGNVETASDLVNELEETLAPDAGHPLVRLTEAIANNIRKRGVGKNARMWSDRLATIIDANTSVSLKTEKKWLAASRKRGPVHSSLASTRVVLVQVIEPSGPRPDRFLYRAYMYHEAPEPESIYVSDTPQSLENIQRVAIRVLRGVIERLRRPEAPTDIELEFFLPRRLLAYPIEDWTISPYSPLGALYVVLVRDWDRFREPILWPSWQRKWAFYEESEDSITSGDDIFRKWVTCSEAPFEPGLLSRELRADSYFSLGLTFPPLPGGQHVDLAEVLDTGAAIMVWPRRHCVHPTGLSDGPGRCSGDLFKQEICRRLAGRRLSELPRIVWEMRKEQRPDERSEAALLWDDPAHLPGVSEFHFGWPHDLEEQ